MLLKVFPTYIQTLLIVSIPHKISKYKSDSIFKKIKDELDLTYF